MRNAEYHSFETPAHLSAWLAEHHATKRELWVRMYKKGSGTPSVNWEDCVVTALAWGWIDGQRSRWMRCRSFSDCPRAAPNPAGHRKTATMLNG